MSNVFDHNNEDLILYVDKFIYTLEDCHDKIMALQRDTEPETQQKHDPLRTFLNCFHTFIQYTRKQMLDTSASTPSQKPSPEEWSEQKQEKDINELKKKIESIKKKYKREEDTKKELISEYRATIEMIENARKEELSEVARKADETMIEEWQMVEHELNNLQCEEKAVAEKYQYVCAENLNNERTVRRGEKWQSEKKLENFISLYDQDIGRKHAEYENVLEQKRLEKLQLESLTTLFEAQQAPYEIMMQEKAIWKEKELSRKLQKLREMLARNTMTKFLNNYVQTLRECNIPIVITKKSKGKKKK